MSWHTINEILGLATIDPAFRQALLQNPLPAIHAQGFQLTDREAQVLASTQANDIYELSQKLIERLGDSGN